MQAATCPRHPELRIDTICFHPLCRQRHQQLVCLECNRQDELHREHLSCVEALHPISPTFQLLTSIQETDCRDKLLRELNQTEEFVQKIEMAILDELRQWKLKRLAKIECLINFFDESSLPQIINNLLDKSSSHDPCCLSLVNLLNDIKNNGAIKPRKIKRSMRDEIMSEMKGLRLKSNNVKEIVLEMLMSQKYGSYNFGNSGEIKDEEGEEGEEREEEAIEETAAQKEFTISEDVVDQEESKSSLDVTPTPIPIPFPFQNGSAAENYGGEQDSLDFSEISALKDQNPEKIAPTTLKKSKAASDPAEKDLPRQHIRITRSRGVKMTITVQSSDSESSLKAVPEVPQTPENSPVKLPSPTKKIVKERKKHALERSPPMLTRKQKIKNNPIEIVVLSSGAESNESDPSEWNEISHQNESCSSPPALRSERHPKGNLNQRLLNTSNDLDEDKLISYITNKKDIEHLIIQDSSLAQDKTLSKLLTACPQIKGLSIQCPHSLSRDFVVNSQIDYFTFMNSYSFLGEHDIRTYFPMKTAKRLSNMQVFNNNRKSFTANTHKEFKLLADSTEQLNILSNKDEESWTVTNKIIVGITLKCKNLKILSFTDIPISSSIKLTEIYQENHSLQTLVFNNCECYLNSIVSEFKSLNHESLEHLQISADKLEKGLSLLQRSFQSICKLTNLRTLILVNIQFKGVEKVDKNHSRRQTTYFRNVSQLQQLTHLNLYRSAPISSDFIEQMSPSVYPLISTLNLGHTRVGSAITPFLSRLDNLKNLNLDWTRVSGKDFLEFMPRLPLLEKLSIENLNNDVIFFDFERKITEMERHGYVSSRHLQELSNPTLRYVNICGCPQLRYFAWDNYPRLQYLKAEFNQLNISASLQLQKRGIQIIEKEPEFPMEQDFRGPTQAKSRLLESSLSGSYSSQIIELDDEYETEAEINGHGSGRKRRRADKYRMGTRRLSSRSRSSADIKLASSQNNLLRGPETRTKAAENFNASSLESKNRSFIKCLNIERHQL